MKHKFLFKFKAVKNSLVSSYMQMLVEYEVVDLIKKGLALSIVMVWILDANKLLLLE